MLKEMKAHPEKKFARRGWNGKGIYIQLQVPDKYSMMTLPYIYMVTDNLKSDNPDAPRGRVPWLASQTDMLCDDWTEVAPTPFGLNRIDSKICSNVTKEFREYRYDNQPNPAREKSKEETPLDREIRLKDAKDLELYRVNYQSSPKSDLVHNPAHYTEGRKYDPWDVFIDWKLDYLTATAAGYIARAGRKQYAGLTMKQSEETDLMKAIECLEKKLSVMREAD